MRATLSLLLGGLALGIPALLAQNSGLKLPPSIEAGSAFSIQSTGSGKRDPLHCRTGPNDQA